MYDFTRNLMHGQNPFYTDNLFYPVGTHTIGRFPADLLGMVNVVIHDYFLTLNLVSYLSFVLSGLGAYFLSYQYLNSRLLALICGFVFAFCPYKLVRLQGHHNLILTAGLPFYIWFFMRAFPYDQKAQTIILSDRRFLACAGAALILTFFSDYYYFFYLLVFTLLYYIFFKFRLFTLSLSRNKFLIWSTLALLVSTVAMWLARHWGMPPASHFTRPDLIGLLLNPHNRFWGHGPAAFMAQAVPYFWETEVYIGYPIILGVIGYLVFQPYRNTSVGIRFVLFAMLSFLLLAFPVVGLAGKPVAATPLYLLRYIPILTGFRNPGRTMIMAMLFLPIMSGLFLKTFVFNHCSYIGRRVLVLSFFVVLFLEYFPVPYHFESLAHTPAAYRLLGSREPGTLWELPFGVTDAYSSFGECRPLTGQMLGQVTHHKKMLGGYFCRLDQKTRAFFIDDPLLRQAVSLQQINNTQKSPPADSIITRPEAFMTKFHIKYILIHPDYRHSPLETFVQNCFGPYCAEILELDQYLLLILK
jgi:hypothetical protein